MTVPLVPDMLCRKAMSIVPYLKLALYFEALYTMKDEYNQQIATEGTGGGLPHGSANVACIPPSLQSQKVYPTSTFCLPGAQNIYAN